MGVRGHEARKERWLLLDISCGSLYCLEKLGEEIGFEKSSLE